MNLADLLFVVLFLTALQLGARLGILRQASVTAGLVLGAFLAALLQGLFAAVIRAPKNELAFWLLTILSVLVIALFFRIGWAIGTELHKRLRKWQVANIVDMLVGCALAGVTAVAVLLFWSALLLKGPNGFVAGQLKDSFVINGMRQAFPQLPDVVAYAADVLDPHSMPQIFASAEPVFTGVSILPDDAFVSRVAARSWNSIVKISGVGCGGTVTGTGFTVGENTVVTNAHVVAGLPAITVANALGTTKADAVLFDPRLDIAILKTERLKAKPMALRTDRLINGTPVVTFGYAEGTAGAHPAGVLEKLEATGYDIYNQTTITRSVYVLSDGIEHGDSGGPMVDEQGDAVGMVFGKSTNVANVGYALTADQIVNKLATVNADSQPVSTGQCGVH